MPASPFNAHLRLAIYANTAIACAKFAAALWTGSTALMATTVHSLADATSLGMIQNYRTREQKPSNATAIYFWAYVAAVLVFSLGAGVAITQGIERLRAPLPTHDASLGMLITAAAVLLHLAWRWHASPADHLRLTQQSTAHASGRPVDPAQRTVMLANTAAIFGGMLATVSLAASGVAGINAAEAWASIGIGLTQGFVAATLATETKAILTQVEWRQPLGQDTVSAALDTPVETAVPLSAEPPQAPSSQVSARSTETPKRNHPTAISSRKAKKRRH